MSSRRFEELDSVVLIRDVDGWPAGSLGAIVWDHGNEGLVEMATEHRLVDGLPERDLFDDLVDVPYDALKLASPTSSSVCRTATNG